MKRGSRNSGGLTQDANFSIDTAPEEIDIVVVGAGLSGINVGYRLQTLASQYNYTILEARDAIGGTWDLFRFPGIRSDSDLATFGFSFRAWPYKESIAQGHLIVSYIRDTAKEFGIDKKIRFKHKVVKAEWSSETARWTVTAIDLSSGGASGTEVKFVCKFMVWGSGYYSYDEGQKVVLPGIENFKGTVAHPQFWPEGLNYDGKKVLIVGSGATAITLLPAVAETAGHVTMLQRSPSYVYTIPKQDMIANVLRMVLPTSIAHSIIRLKNITIAEGIYQYCQWFPERAKKMLRSATEAQLPPHIPYDPHFVPAYNPWDQRLCITPNGEFYEALRKGNCTIVTNHIDTFTETGVKLKSGEELEADLIVTATGLKLQLLGGAKMYVDGEQVLPEKRFIWKGSMLNSVPNMALSIGYVHTSWTLGSDVCARFICRILNDMHTKQCDIVVPRLTESTQLEPRPLLNLSSTYLKNAADVYPKSSTTKPWVARHNFFGDWWKSLFQAHGDQLHFESLSGKSEDVETSKLL